MSGMSQADSAITREVEQWKTQWEHDLISDGNCQCTMRRHHCDRLQRKYLSRLPDGAPHFALALCRSCKHEITDKDETPAHTQGARKFYGLTEVGLKECRKGYTRALKAAGRIS